MKNLLYLLTLCLFTLSLGVRAQSFSFVDPHENVYGWSDQFLIATHFDIQNNASDTIRAHMGAEVIKHVTGSVNYFCWGPNCYPDAVRTSLEIAKIPPNDTNGSFIGDYQPKGYAGTTTIKYTWFDSENEADRSSYVINYIAIDAPEIVGSLTTCANGTTTLGLKYPADSYLWSTGDSTETIEVGPGTYTVDVTYKAWTKTSVEVTVTEMNALTPMVQGPTSYCEVDEVLGIDNVTLDAGAHYDSYLWSTGDTTRFITATAGTYAVEVTAAGCTGSSDSVVVEEHANPEKPLIMQNNGVLSTQNAAEHFWYNQDNFFIYKEEGQWFEPKENGEYRVLVTDAITGCGTFSDAFDVNNVGLDDIVEEGDAFRVFPNPASDHLVFEAQGNSAANRIVIHDLLGAVAKNVMIAGNGQRTVVDLGSLRSGVYFYSIMDEQRVVESRKFIVSR